MRQIKAAPAHQFDPVFVESMSRHHGGAVKMADQMWHSGGDLRLRVMAHAIRHEQQGEIALMHGATALPPSPPPSAICSATTSIER